MGTTQYLSPQLLGGLTEGKYWSTQLRKSTNEEELLLRVSARTEVKQHKSFNCPKGRMALKKPLAETGQLFTKPASFLPSQTQSELQFPASLAVRHSHVTEL